MEIMVKNLPYLVKALPVTFYMLFTSVLIAFVLGILLTWQRLSKNRILRGMASVYISYMRGTPILIQLLIVFIVVPMVLGNYGVDTSSWNNMTYAIFAFSLNEAAFFSEIFRSSYLAMDKGQIEAAQSLGMSRIQVFLHITFPETTAIALPNTTNMIIELMKNTALGAVIGVYDILAKAQQLAENNYGVGQQELFILVSVMFWVIGIIFMAIANGFVKRLNKGEWATRNQRNTKLIQRGSEAV